MSEENLKLFKKHGGYEVTDPCHIIACGTPNQLSDNVLKENYLAMSFSFEYLQRAEMYFKSIHGDLFVADRLKVMFPKTQRAPIIFIYDYGDNEQIFAIAPRYNVDHIFDDNKKESHNLESVSEKQ